MPVLKSYADDSGKSGYYVHAPVSNRDSPITLQATDTAAQIYRWLGYDPDERGDGNVAVPNELTWKLYVVGLHWTESELSRSVSGGESTWSSDDGPRLTAADVEAVEAFLSSYEGGAREELEDLLEKLRDGDPAESHSGPIDGRTPGIWTATDSDLNRYADALADDLRQEFSADEEPGVEEVELSRYVGDDGQRNIGIGVRFVDLDALEQYRHQLFVCEEHGLEHCRATTLADLDWTKRAQLEHQRAAVIESLVGVAKQFRFSIGEPDRAYGTCVERECADDP